MSINFAIKSVGPKMESLAAFGSAARFQRTVRALTARLPSIMLARQGVWRSQASFPALFC